jgi:RNA polymerase sigma-70 factor (ECF subfamily)
LTDQSLSELSKVYNLCLRLCHREGEAIDLCQDIFIHAAHFHQENQENLSPVIRLYQIAIRLWKNRIRSTNRRLYGRHFLLSPHHKEQETSPKQIPQEWRAVSDNHQRILRALDRLDADEKIMLILRDMEGMPYEDMATTMGIPLRQLKSKLFRARERLHEVHHRMGGKIVS